MEINLAVREVAKIFFVFIMHCNLLVLLFEFLVENVQKRTVENLSHMGHPLKKQGPIPAF